MGLITQPMNFLSIPPNGNVTMGRDFNVPPYYREMSSFKQRIQQIDATRNRLFSTRHQRDSQDLVSIPGFKVARTETERDALRNIYDARRIGDKYDNGVVRLLYVKAIVDLNSLDRNSYTLEEYVSLQELKVSCQWFLTQYSGMVGQIPLRAFDLQLADLYKELGKDQNDAAASFLLRSAELRMQVAKDSCDTEQAMRLLKEAIYDLTVISRNSPTWSKINHDLKIRLLTLARSQLEALKNPSLFQRIGNTFQRACEWMAQI